MITQQYASITSCSNCDCEQQCKYLWLTCIVLCKCVIITSMLNRNSLDLLRVWQIDLTAMWTQAKFRSVNNGSQVWLLQAGLISDIICSFHTSLHLCWRGRPHELMFPDYFYTFEFVLLYLKNWTFWSWEVEPMTVKKKINITQDLHPIIYILLWPISDSHAQMLIIDHH